MPKKPCAARGCGRLVPAGQTYCQRHAEIERKRRWAEIDARRAARPSRAWYRTRAWRAKAAAQLKAQPLCQMCPEWSPRPATIADHVVPHRDDRDLFWGGALQSLCASCHSSRKQRLERLDDLPWHMQERRMPRGLRPSAVPLTIVCGPPASGKTSYVRHRAAAGDVVIDLDQIRRRVGGDLGAALDERNRMLAGLADLTGGAAWFIVAAPEPDDRRMWQAMLGGRLVVLDVPAAECVARIRADPLRLGRQAALIRAVEDWWKANPQADRGQGGVNR